MKGYKATYNMKCKSFPYEVGKTYKMDNIEMCLHGFHFCKKMKDVLNYYLYNKQFILLEVETLSDNIITEGDKSVTDHIKIVRVIPKEEYEFEIPLMEYDSSGNLISYKSKNECYWNEYDSNNNLIHHKNSNYQYWNEYDSNNNLIHHKNSNNYQYWKEYDSNNNEIYTKSSEGYESWKEYDSNNNVIRFEDSAKEYWNEYDSNNNEIHRKYSRGHFLKDFEYWKEYDSNNNLIHYTVPNKFEYWNEYDAKNNLISYRDSTGKNWRITIS